MSDLIIKASVSYQVQVSDETFWSKHNPLTPKIGLLILPSGSYTFPCKLVTRIWC